MRADKPEHEKAADVIRFADGKVVGRTRLQKLSYLLELAGYGQGFEFSYKHYGPYSEQLRQATRSATALGLVKEIENPTSWGGYYSTFSADARPTGDVTRDEFTTLINEADAVELELAATAAFLAVRDEHDPWGETARRKPDKVARGRLERARNLYARLKAVQTPCPLPPI